MERSVAGGVPDAKSYTYRNRRYSDNEMLALRRTEKLARHCIDDVRLDRPAPTDFEAITIRWTGRRRT